MNKRNKQMKVITAIMALCMAMTGCGKSNGSDNDTNSASDTVKVTQYEAENTDPSSAESTESAETAEESESGEEVTTPAPVEEPTEEPPAVTDGVDESQIPIIYSHDDFYISIGESDINLGEVGLDFLEGCGFSYDWEHDEVGLFYVSNLRSEAKNRGEFYEGNVLEQNDTSKGFIFSGTAMVSTFQSEINTEDEPIYIETVTDEDGEEIYTALGFDISRIPNGVESEWTFARTGKDANGRNTGYADYFKLGDGKDKVESLIGKGYEYGEYAFYIGMSEDFIDDNEDLKVYFIVEYGADDTVQKVFILHRDLIG